MGAPNPPLIRASVNGTEFHFAPKVLDKIPARPLHAQAVARRAVPRFAIPRIGNFDPLLTGAALLKAVSAETKANFVFKSYGDAKWAMFDSIDNVIVEGAHGVFCSYSGIFVPGTSGHGRDYKERGDENGDGNVDSGGMNVEHVWPQSYFNEKTPMRADLHHLLPTFIHINSMRGRLPFGEVPDDEISYQTDSGAKLATNRLFEPPDGAKGRVARGLLYFFARYHDEEDNIFLDGAKTAFWHASLAVLMDWNERFPPDDWERERNARIEAFQGNRNPFVDDHTLAGRIGIENFRVR